jgi:hypothetical protein
MSSTKSNTPVKVVGLITVIAGLVMIVAGGLTWALVTTQLKAEQITVSAVTDKAPGSLAGQLVAGPFTAYAQANAIDHHALTEAKGRTYAQLGADAKALKAKLAASGVAKDAIDKDPGVVALADSRKNTMNGSFLRASLFTSVISFGVAALVIALGVLFSLLGLALVKVSAPIVIASSSTSSSTRAAVGASA